MHELEASSQLNEHNDILKMANTKLLHASLSYGNKNLNQAVQSSKQILLHQ